MIVFVGITEENKIRLCINNKCVELGAFEAMRIVDKAEPGEMLPGDAAKVGMAMGRESYVTCTR